MLSRLPNIWWLDRAGLVGKIFVMIFLLGAQTDLETMSEVRLCQSNPFTWEKLHYKITCECFFLTNRKHLMLACRLQMIILRNLVEMMCQESIYWSHYNLSESLLQGDHSGMLGVLENFNFYVKYKAICRTQGSGMTEWLGCWTCNSEAPSSSPMLTTSWICSW